MAPPGTTKLITLLASVWAATLLPSARVLAIQTTEAADTVVFTCGELLGRPTDRSIALNLCAAGDAEIFIEYGTQHGSTESQTPVRTLQAGVPATITISSLLPDTRYFYRVRYRTAGTTEFTPRDEHTFHTARPRGRQFVFAIEADPHLDSATNPTLYRRTLANILGSNAEFLIDLGDTFMSDKLPVKSQQEILSRHLLLRSFFDSIAHSVPLILTIGNHEGEQGWLLDGTPDNVAVWASSIRTAYYPNPIPDGFYSGMTQEENFVGLRQSTSAWEWGDALLVVLDPYWYTTRKPGSSKDNWDWTLGKPQYDWLVETLARSTARFKFIFIHHLVGGIDNEGRGGIEGAPFYEMGGRNADSTWGFTTRRPGWSKPLHQVMVENSVTALFHGHDHVYVRQELDGIVYQELPQPGYFNFTNPEKSYSNGNLAEKYSYTHGVVVSSSGFLRVTVNDSSAAVDYVRSYLPEYENSQRHNGEVAFSYVLRPRTFTSSAAVPENTPADAPVMQSFPNPFNPATTIEYRLDASGQVDLGVFDLIGREVARLVSGVQTAGLHRACWNASGCPTGIYYCRLRAGDQMHTITLSFIK